MTNHEKIKNMSVEQMASFLYETTYDLALKLDGVFILNDEEHIKKWLLEEEISDNG